MWVSQPLAESINGYEFNILDGPVCRANFVGLEEIIAANGDQYEADIAEFEGLYQTAFFNMQTFNINLVDNENFIETFTTPDHVLNPFL